MQPAHVGSFQRRDESPIGTQAGAEQQPIPPRNMVGKQEDRSGRGQGGFVEDFVAVQPAQNELYERPHTYCFAPGWRRRSTISHVTNAPTPIEQSGPSQRSTGKVPGRARGVWPLMVCYSPGNAPVACSMPVGAIRSAIQELPTRSTGTLYSDVRIGA